MKTVDGLDQPAICKNNIVLKNKDVWGVSFKASFEEVDIITDCGLDKSQLVVHQDRTY